MKGIDKRNQYIHVGDRPKPIRKGDQRSVMVTVKTIDRLVIAFVAGIGLFGGYSWLRATRQTRNHMMTMPGMDPVWYLFGTLIAVSVVIGTYVLSRDQLRQILSTPSTRDPSPANRSDRENPENHREPASSPDQSSREPPSARGKPSPVTYLPEDEQRIVEPILESPGLTQVELRGRSDFSKSKVSQTVSKLEDRGLIYRERQGRTYRVYPGELLTDRE